MPKDLDSQNSSLHQLSDYEDTFKDIKLDASESSDRSHVLDQTLKNSVENERERDRLEYKRRDSLYTNLLEYYYQDYQEKSYEKKLYKKLFFYIVLSSFLGIVIASIGALIFISRKPETSLSDLGIALSSSAGMISALVILPKIIAEHLFPVDEDKNMIDMVKNMQINDSGIRRDTQDIKNS